MTPRELTELAEYTWKLLQGAINWDTQTAERNEVINIIRCALEKAQDSK